jgi:beta-xylosidase
VIQEKEMARSIPSALRTRWAATALLIVVGTHVLTQQAWSAQTSRDRYRNPILFADYSDPDVIRDGDNYYLVASTFEFVPGIPILQSHDLVHWTIIGHVLPRITLDAKYDMAGGNRYGGGVWAPSIRKHDGRFYVYFPTPDEGIFMSSAASITGPWTEPVAVIAQAGLEDPCPFWDDDGNAYLVRSKKGAGPLILHRLSSDGTKVLDEGKEIVHDPQELPTLEGPKLYKRNGYYYIFAPFGGVGKGPQVVLRSKSIYGPYEHRVVLAQGTTKINGPHQGGYVETPDGQGWFLHFQLRGGHGRIVHLEPVRWEQDWPIIGQAVAGAATGEPVESGPIPHHVGRLQKQSPQTSDEFRLAELAPQWEWNHNPDNEHWSLTERPGFLRLKPMHAEDLFAARNTLTQMMQDESLQFTTQLDITALTDGVHAGLAMFEKSASGLQIVQNKGERRLSFFHLADVQEGPLVTRGTVELRVDVEGDAATYSYSFDGGHTFQQLGPTVPITFSWWKGSRPSLFAYTKTDAGESGHVDFDWVRYQSTEKKTP